MEPLNVGSLPFAGVSAQSIPCGTTALPILIPNIRTWAMSWQYISSCHKIFSLHGVIRHPHFDESSPKINSENHVLKVINPFYLNREGGGPGFSMFLVPFCNESWLYPNFI
jgi:hypothetical protein